MTSFPLGLSLTWKRFATRAPLAIAVTLALTGCGQEKASTPAAGKGAPVLPVGVITAEPAQVAVVTELPGRVDASRVAEVRARVAGIVQKREIGRAHV